VSTEPRNLSKGPPPVHVPGPGPIPAHIEAVPADEANIKARAFGIKTAGDLAQYHKEITPVVNNARVLARQRKVAA